MLDGIEHGLAPDVEQVADLIKKVSPQPHLYATRNTPENFDLLYVSAQVKLGNSIAGKMGDGKRKDNLIKAGAAISKLMGLMVVAVRDGGIHQLSTLVLISRLYSSIHSSRSFIHY